MIGHFALSILGHWLLVAIGVVLIAFGIAKPWKLVIPDFLFSVALAAGSRCLEAAISTTPAIAVRFTASRWRAERRSRAGRRDDQRNEPARCRGQRA